MPSIGHIIFNISNFERSEAFYDKVLLGIGFTSNHREDGDEVALKSYRMNEHNIWIKCEKGADHQSFVRDVGLDHLALFVEDRKKVDEMYEVIQQLDVKITREPREYPEYSSTYYAFTFRDPDGIPFEIAIE